ncbi:MAG: hypothetical protein IPO86_00790 [Saprospiraceae bacterium]|nr:hypothetical protein [Saprospiraceae bacterium]
MHTYTFVLLFIIQSIVACQQLQLNALLLKTNNTYQSKLNTHSDLVNPIASASGKVFQSVDFGQTWQDISAGLPIDLEVQCIYADNNKVYLGHEHGLFKSKTSTPAPIWEQEALLIDRVLDIFEGKTGIYALSDWKGFFQEIPKTGIWKPTFTSLKDKFIRCVLDNPDGSILVGCDSGIYKSYDGGSTWKAVCIDNQVLNIISWNGVLIGAAYNGLLRSEDAGENWHLVSYGKGSVRAINHFGDYFVAITNGVGPWKEIMADPDGMANHLLISKDSGKTWQQMEESFTKGRFIYDLDKKPSVQFINDIEHIGQYIFCSLDTGIYRSSDNGKTWKLMHPTSEGKMFNFAVSNKVIYAIKGSMLGGC